MASPRSTKVRNAVLLVVALSFALVGAACGGSDSSDDAGEGGASASGTVPETTPKSTTTTTEAGQAGTPDEAVIPGATIFVDPDGRYTIEVSPDWEDGTGTGAVPADIELFYVGTGTADFRNNINVLEQSVPSGMTLQGYLDASIAQMGSDLEVITKGVDEGAYGQELGYIEYKGMVATAPIPVHAFATFFIQDGKVVLATLTTTEDTAADAEDTVAEYLTTLNPTGGGSGSKA
jgi:hypothetical protein